jgi:hypothetical protein
LRSRLLSILQASLLWQAYTLAFVGFALGLSVMFPSCSSMAICIHSRAWARSCLRISGVALGCCANLTQSRGPWPKTWNAVRAVNDKGRHFFAVATNVGS